MSIFDKSIEIARADFDPNCEMRCQVWSFAFLRTRLVCFGRNQNKTHPLNLKNKLTFHGGGFHINKGMCAELGLFLKIKKTNLDFSRLTVINVRLDKHKNICMSAPCNSCKSLINFAQPNRLFFTNNVGQFEEYSI